VTGIRTDSAVKATRVSWQPVDASDLCYYRVFRRRETRWDQIGSTIATHLLDPAGRQGDAYRVVAVDCFGNASE
jgi:hypothetical protein